MIQRSNSRPEPEPEPEQVDHPAHYNAHPSGVECIDVVEHMTFCVGNAVKYCWRAGLKVAAGEMTEEARLRDLQKAAWYLRREIETLEEAMTRAKTARVPAPPRPAARGAR